MSHSQVPATTDYYLEYDILQETYTLISEGVLIKWGQTKKGKKILKISDLEKKLNDLEEQFVYKGEEFREKAKIGVLYFPVPLSKKFAVDFREAVKQRNEKRIKDISLAIIENYEDEEEQILQEYEESFEEHYDPDEDEDEYF